jgi:hypothetical protein
MSPIDGRHGEASGLTRRAPRRKISATFMSTSVAARRVGFSSVTLCLSLRLSLLVLLLGILPGGLVI